MTVPDLINIMLQHQAAVFIRDRTPISDLVLYRHRAARVAELHSQMVRLNQPTQKAS